VYFLPAVVPLALLAAAGVSAIAGLLHTYPFGSKIPWAIAFIVAVLGLSTGWDRFQTPSSVLGNVRLNLFQGHQGDRLEDAFAALPSDSTVVADWDQATVFWYAQFVDGKNRSVRISYPTSTLPNAVTQSVGPVFLATATTDPATSNVTMVGPFVQVLTKPNVALPPGLVTVGCVYDGQIELVGIEPLSQPKYGVLPVTLYWKALRPPTADYSVSVRLMPTSNRIAVQSDEASPVLGLSPTSHWITGQVTADYYELDLSRLSFGEYDLVVVVYQPLPLGFHNAFCGDTAEPVIYRIGLSHGGLQFSRPSGLGN
jgi:hypothetical protein